LFHSRREKTKKVPRKKSYYKIERDGEKTKVRGNAKGREREKIDHEPRKGNGRRTSAKGSCHWNVRRNGRYGMESEKKTNESENHQEGETQKERGCRMKRSMAFGAAVRDGSARSYYKKTATILCGKTGMEKEKTQKEKEKQPLAAGRLNLKFQKKIKPVIESFVF